MHVWLSLSLCLSPYRTWQHFTFIVAVVCVAVGGTGVRGGGGHSKVPVMAGETRKPTVQTVRATWPQVLSCLSCLLCSGPPYFPLTLLSTSYE